MRQPLLIPGESFTTPAAPEPGRSRAARWLRVLIVAWLVGGLGFFLVRVGAGKRSPEKGPTDQVKSSVTALSAEDLVHHMETVNAELLATAAKLRRAEDHIVRTFPAIDRNYLLVEKRHLESALAITEAARHDMEQSRQEVELVLNSLKKEQLQ